MSELSIAKEVTAEDSVAGEQTEHLIRIFNTLFNESENTRLVMGQDEPVYLPADQTCSYHRVVFAHGFFASALHEIAHWCIAGKLRRQQLDYGYWYEPDGRDLVQQAEFEQVEVKPQALEWIFSKACNKKFRVSIDNLNGQETDSTAFKKAVYQQVLDYCLLGLPVRAELLWAAFCRFYSPCSDLCPNQYSNQYSNLCPDQHAALDPAAFHLAELD